MANELKELYEKLTKERDEIMEKVTPLQERREALIESIRPVEAEIKAVEKAIHDLERPRLVDILNQIGPLAVALGGKKLSAAQPAEEAANEEGA